ncbi:TetR family transcriptional regulator [Agromyces sp. CFH 90414]|uniref:TetR family transcriptional regulator n=1 Tax=Agromyces agglutinans TaxID=2662258 RepID=A0A6I2FDP7_9MICO|nr:TetR/AcrR family transcriptional regulator [Agromyces agglutinans]MRG59218.1 TetR family transcriptional regulator [Agromyces agglutinans]
MSTTTAPPKRADARRNIEAIIEAATALLAVDPDASVQEIAKAAGVGRVTLYGHFDSRTALVTEVATRAVAQTEAALSDIDLSGDAGEAMARLLETTWHLTHRFGGIVVAAGQVLPPEAMRRAHVGLHERARALVERGRRAGRFRADMPVEWQITAIQAVLHAASGSVHRGELDADEAPRLVRDTALALLASPTSR